MITPRQYSEAYLPLFLHMVNEYDLILTVTEMNEILLKASDVVLNLEKLSKNDNTQTIPN